MKGLVRHKLSTAIPSISIKSFEVLLAYYLETSGNFSTTMSKLDLELIPLGQNPVSAAGECMLCSVYYPRRSGYNVMYS